jgi:hypothetical protein
VILVDANGGNEKGENSPSTAKEFVDIKVVARPDDTIPPNVLLPTYNRDCRCV